MENSFEFENLGSVVKNLRISKGYTQAEVAKALKVTPGYISNVENGRTAMSPHILAYYAALTGDTMDRFIGRFVPEYRSTSLDNELSRVIRPLSDEQKEKILHTISLWAKEGSQSRTEANPAKPEGEAGAEILHRMNRSHSPLREFGLPHVSWKPEMRILDAGCGGGATIRQMLDLSENSHIEGIDYSEVSVEESRKLNQEFLGDRVHIQKADVAHLPFEENAFDLVTAVETVYFWPDVQAAFREVLRVLKPDGQFMILDEGSDPNRDDWPVPKESFFRIYRAEELENLLKKEGFRETEAYHGQGEYICVIGRK